MNLTGSVNASEDAMVTGIIKYIGWISKDLARPAKIGINMDAVTVLLHIFVMNTVINIHIIMIIFVGNICKCSKTSPIL